MGQYLRRERGRNPGGVDLGPRPMLRRPAAVWGREMRPHADTAVRPTGPPHPMSSRFRAVPPNRIRHRGPPADAAG